MPISLTCTCGARLEFDDAFAGKVIPCPDCGRPLATVQPESKPVVAPLEFARPDQRTSGLAMSSVLLALVGAFTIIGSLAAAGLGWFAIRHIDESQGKLGGRRTAKVGIILGLLFTLVTSALLFVRSPLRIDGFLRTLEWAGTLDYSVSDIITQKTEKGQSISMKRPEGFGKVVLNNPNVVKRDDILLYSPYDDAYLACLAYHPPDDEEIRESAQRLKKVNELLEQSDMVRMIYMRRIPDKPRIAEGPGKIEVPIFYRNPYPLEKNDTLANTEWEIFGFDIDLRGRPREMLVYYARVDNLLLVKVGLVRKEPAIEIEGRKENVDERFKRLHPALESALKSTP